MGTKIKQHSIGSRYITLKLCLNSEVEEDKDYKANWNKYYTQLINKELVDNKGYFYTMGNKTKLTQIDKDEAKRLQKEKQEKKDKSQIIKK